MWCYCVCVATAIAAIAAATAGAAAVAAAVAAATAMRLLVWESDLNVKLRMWSVVVFGLVCFPLCSTVRMNERLCLAFGLSSVCVVFLDRVSLVALIFVLLVPVTESVDDVDLPYPSAAIPMPAPLLSFVPGRVSDAEEASEVQADEASEAKMDDKDDMLSVLGTPPLQRAAKRRAETGLGRLAKSVRGAPRDVHAQRVARVNKQRAREGNEAVQTSDDEGALSCAVLLTMSEKGWYLLFPLE